MLSCRASVVHQLGLLAGRQLGERFLVGLTAEGGELLFHPPPLFAISAAGTFRSVIGPLPFSRGWAGVATGQALGRMT